jgi:hypothetical protein
VPFTGWRNGHWHMCYDSDDPDLEYEPNGDITEAECIAWMNRGNDSECTEFFPNK